MSLKKIIHSSSRALTIQCHVKVLVVQNMVTVHLTEDLMKDIPVQPLTKVMIFDTLLIVYSTILFRTYFTV